MAEKTSQELTTIRIPARAKDIAFINKILELAKLDKRTYWASVISSAAIMLSDEHRLGDP